jgi:L-ribulokinase
VTLELWLVAGTQDPYRPETIATVEERVRQVSVASPRSYAIGIDYGTASARALAVDTATGEELAECVERYPGGVVGSPGDANLARQEPRDYEDALEVVLQGVTAELRECGALDEGRVTGIGFATTGSTPLPLGGDGRALAADPRFRDDPAAKAWLWKDHTAHAEAAEITDALRAGDLPYLAYVGGTYSSEWFWAKILRCARTAPDVFAAAATWCELSDYAPALATGAGLALSRNACAAGHKAMFSRMWGGLPSEAFLAQLAPELAALRARLYDDVQRPGDCAGTLHPELASRVGLTSRVAVAVGTFDAHAGAVAAGVRPGRLVKIMGTSTCDCTVTTDGEPRPIPGVCGVVQDSVLPGRVGVEAGQSAVGDLFDWFVRELAPPELGGHEGLSRAAESIAPGASGVVALDWNNGNRTVLVDPRLSGLFVGQTLATTAPEMYRALIEATAFGSRVIVEQIERFSEPIDDVVVSGGLAQSALAMQIYADVFNRPVRLARSANASAAGAAIFGAVAAGAHPDTEHAQAAMGGVADLVYRPQPDAVRTYARLYGAYRRLHDAFACDGELAFVMKELLDIRDRSRA